MKNLIYSLSSLFILLSGCKAGKYADLGEGIFADIQTTKGDIVVQLYHEATPVTVANFVSLAEGNSPFVDEKFKDKKYYDGLIFHRVIKDFMLQGGCPDGTGMGNPGYKFKDEFVDTLRHSGKGLLSMANSGPKTNGSQFFITHKPTPWLDGKHTVFGEVVKGLEIVDSIANVKTVPQDKPEVDVVMNKVEIVRNGKSAKKFDAVEIMTTYFEEAEKEIAAFEKFKEELVFQFQEQIDSAETTESGLKILKLKEGTGERPKTGQNVLVNYSGWLMADGKLFDSNVLEVVEKFNMVNAGRRDQGGYSPMKMLYSPESPLFPGFREGLLTMKVGDKVRLFLPSYLGTGERDYGPIPGGSTLVFDVEITEIIQ